MIRPKSLMRFVPSDLGSCDFIMPKEVKSSTRNVKISVKRITEGQTEASRIESFLKREGQREFVPYLAKAACAVGVDAIFIETHEDPNNAPSDGPNMIRIDDLRNLMIKLNQIHKITNRN